MQRWVPRKGKEPPPWVLIVYGLGMTAAGIHMINNRGPHAINPAPLAAIPFFFAVGIWCLAIRIARVRKRSKGL